MMYELEKSDSLVVPTKSANKTGLLVAESIEGIGGIARDAEMLKVWVTHYNGRARTWRWARVFLIRP